MAKTWEETVMIKKELSKINDAMPSEAKYGDVFLAIANKQAKLTWKAREPEIEEAKKLAKKVVEWIDEHSRMTYEHGKGEVAFNHVNWHTRLKEWGL
jgi:hypothetical protein